MSVVYGGRWTETVELTDSLDELCIAREPVLFYVDSVGSLGFQEVYQEFERHRYFTPSTAADLINEYTPGAYWLFFEVTNTSAENRSYRLEMFDFDIDEITLYKIVDGRVDSITAGFQHLFHKRAVDHKNVGFDLSVGFQDTVHYFMRFQSRKKNVLEPMVRTYERMVNYGLKEYVLLGLFYGLMLLMIFYNLLYYLILRRVHYVLYVLYASGSLLCFLNQNGTGFQYLWPNLPQINPWMGEIGLFVSTVALLLFSNSFLALHKQYPQFYRWVLVLLALRLVVFVLEVSIPLKGLVGWADLISIQFVFFIGIVVWRRGKAEARWYVLAYLLLDVAFLISFLEGRNVIPSSAFTVYVLYGGVVFQFVFLSIAIAERVREVFMRKNAIQTELIRQYKVNEALSDKVNRELEEKVQRRTKELTEAHEELEARNEEINQMNLALDLANRHLEKSVSKMVKSSTIRGYLTFEDFKKAFPDDFACKKYIDQLKAERGFVCKKCGSTSLMKGKSRFDRRCGKCGYNESVTANTIFHRSKFPLVKGFYMLYFMTQSRQGTLSVSTFCTNLEIQPSTYSNFLSKVEARNTGGRRVKVNHWESLILDEKSG